MSNVLQPLTAFGLKTPGANAQIVHHRTDLNIPGAGGPADKSRDRVEISGKPGEAHLIPKPETTIYDTDGEVLAAFPGTLKAALEHAVGEGKNLASANLRGTDLTGANLHGAKLIGANLIAAKLNGADLNGANLNGANLNGANLNGANLNNANLRDANLRGANLRGANLNDADLTRAKLHKTDLRGAYYLGEPDLDEQEPKNSVTREYLESLGADPKQLETIIRI